MANEDWFRNSTWTPAIEKAFREKLRRARNKSQYLRLQAHHLVQKHPSTALLLLSEYFALGDIFDLAAAYCNQAEALKALGRYDEAFASYQAALAREQQFPNYGTYAYLDYGLLAVERAETQRYQGGLDILDQNTTGALFPVVRYKASGVRAIVLWELGKKDQAKVAARLALDAARETKSGLTYHPFLGLVRSTTDRFYRRIAKIAS